MRLIDYGGFTMDPTAVNLVGKVEFKQDRGHGFVIIVNGSPITIGSEPQKAAAESNRAEFIELLRASLNELEMEAV